MGLAKAGGAGGGGCGALPREVEDDEPAEDEDTCGKERVLVSLGQAAAKQGLHSKVRHKSVRQSQLV